MTKLSQKAKKLSKGVIGIDEVGRGPLAGPVTVCAVYIEDEKQVRKELFSNTVRDSKKLSKINRESIYRTIRNKRNLNMRIDHAISSRSAGYIDTHGISKAIQQCLLSCVRTFIKKGIEVENIEIRLDAGLVIPLRNLHQRSFIKGDETFTEIALASVIAKVTRDSYMSRLAKKHTEYAWERNVGYGTKAHREAIEKVGITKYHRKSYLKAFKLFSKAR